jgi:cell division protein FtsI/penicillin-binding protein 2
MSKGFASNYRVVLLATGILICFGGVAARLVSLSVLDRPELLKFIEQARRSFDVEYARRGNIRDARGEILATSRPYIDIGLDPQALRAADEARWPELARLLHLSVADIRAAAARRTVDAPGDDRGPRPVQWVKLAEGVDETVDDQVKALKIRGVYGNRNYRRFYPYNSLAAHVIGYLNREGTPVAGVERYMDFYLRGENGWRESERDGRRRELAQFQTREVPPVDGYDVTLSLDMNIQHMIEAELQAIVQKYAPEKATIIVSDARTGFLLGLANYPTFNLNEYNKAPIADLRNYAVTDVYDPGSTFKIVAVSGAFNERLVTPDSAFDCSLDEVLYRGRRVRLPPDDEPNGVLSVAEILARSSNRGTDQLAMLLGAQRFYGYVRAFGFGQKTGFPFGGEVEGLMAAPKDWDGLTITRMPIGYSIGVTPMQMHYAMATIASGGVLMRPQLFREVRDERHQLVFDFGDRPSRRVISAATARTMALLLEGVASPGGTAPDAGIPHFEVAGKTGTSQQVIDGRYSPHHHVGSFVGFLPASRPDVVISVIVNGGDARCPGGVAYGRIIAAPSFRRIAEQLIQYRNIVPVTDLSANRLALQRPARSGAGMLQ